MFQSEQKSKKAKKQKKIKEWELNINFNKLFAHNYIKEESAETSWSWNDLI